MAKRHKSKPAARTANERAMLSAGKRMALAGVMPAAVLLANKGRKRGNPPSIVIVKPSSIRKGAWTYGAVGFPAVTAMKTKAGAIRRAETMAKEMGGTVKVFDNPRKNPVGTAADRFEDFHGEAPKEVLEWTEQVHYHGVTSDIGKLVSVKIRVPRVRGGGVVRAANFKGAHLTMNEAGTQVYVEGGDQSLDLATFGVKTAHDKEYLGELVEVTYFTSKKHLGRDGGTANYVHRFGKMESSGKKTELPQVFYDVLNEEILIAGGGYEIPSEGIDG